MLIETMSWQNMEMVLPAGIPMLCVKNMKNYTKLDNVLVLAGIAERVLKCGTREERLVCTSHLPIVGAFDLEVTAKAMIERRNFYNIDWKTFQEELSNELKKVSVSEQIKSKEDLTKKVKELEAAIQKTVNKEVSIVKITPYSKRWWNDTLKKKKKEVKKTKWLAY